MVMRSPIQAVHKRVLDVQRAFYHVISVLDQKYHITCVITRQKKRVDVRRKAFIVHPDLFLDSL